jgi:hypothetical protein
MRDAKRALSVRLSETSHKQLNALTRAQKLSQAAVIAVLIQAATDGWDLDDLDRAYEIARIAG